MTPRHDSGHDNVPVRRRSRPPPDRMVTGEPQLPLDPVEIPDLELPSLPPGPVLVENLDEQLPLVLFPVRLATRFHRGDGPGTAPSELLVRIFPDVLHADSHHLTLTPEEVALGHAYWERLWRLGRNRAGRQDTHRWLVSQLGAPRAAWVAALTEPTNSQDAPLEPATRTSPLETKPIFAPLAQPEPSRPTLARLLPDRWYVRIAQHNEFVHEVWSKPVRRDLAMAPNVADIPDGGDIRDLLRNQGLWWMADFEEAVDAGMGMRVPLDKNTSKLITDLVVFGVRDRDPGAAAELAGLLDAHRFTSGLEIVTHGTPTNTTPTVDAGYTDVPTDLEAYLARQLNEPEVSRPPLDSPATLGSVTAAKALALSFGLEGATAFDVAEHADDRTGARAEAMNRALWPSTWGHFLSTLLAPNGTPIIAEPDLDWLQNWFRDWVRGPGLLPVFRAGEQPYGVLPVTVLPYQDEFPDTRIGHLQSVLHKLRYNWRGPSDAVSSFSRPATRTPEEEAVAVASVLGAVPHPIAFRLRRAFDRSDRFAREYEEGLTELEHLLAPTLNLLLQAYEQRKDLIYNGSIEDQSHNLAGLRDIAEGMIDTHSDIAAEITAVRDHVDKVVWLGAVVRHTVRSETRLLSERFSDATLPDPSDPALWYVEYGADGAAADGTFPELKLVPGGGPEGDPLLVAESLRGLAADARSVTPTHRPVYDSSSPQSLLRVLIEHGIEQVRPTHAEELAVGLDRLADMCEAGAVEAPIDELARLLRETLGLATHRLDAWITSVAAHRLAELRADRPTGLQIGGYGWLVELTPDTGGPDTHGFVHAPSLDHAATAAVLRSAWLACADGSANAAFGVDLSSERVRRAEWLLEGVRNGVDLAELLGARFERRLHDARLDHLAAEVREAVLIEAGHPDLPANAIVDGLALAVAYQDGAESLLRDRIDALRVPLDGYPDDALLRALQETTGDLDATADALMAQSVHSLVKGNLAEASAALAASGSGDAGIPELRMARVHRESQNVSHRVTAVFGNGRPASSSVLATAEPALAAWLESLLAGLDQVPVAGGDTPLRVGALGLGAAEVVTLAATGGQLAGSRLGAVLLGLTKLASGPRPEASHTLTPGAGDAVTLGELAVVAGALRTAIGQSRALRGEDLAGPGDASPKIDVDELDRRRLTLADRLDDLAAAPPTDATLRSRAADLAAVDDVGTIAALGAQETERRPLIAAVLAKAARRAAALRAPLPERWNEWSAAARAQHLANRIDEALALKLPVLARFRPTNSADLVASARLSERRLGSPMAASTWLLQAGRVHAGAGRVDEALGLLAAVRGEPVTAEQVVQIPHVPDDPWVAVAGPASSGGRTCMLSFTDLVAAIDDGPVSGLLFDAWTEPLPNPTATTGVAVHFDSPGAQPPQVVLVATVAPGELWSVDTLRSIVSQALELAQIRAVGPETLQSWGHSLPAIFLPEGVAVATADDGEATTVASR